MRRKTISWILEARNRDKTWTWLRKRNLKKTKKKQSEYSKLVQKKYKPRNDWVGKVIQWELYKKLKLLTNGMCTENVALEILLDFEIQMNHWILARRPNLRSI